MDIKAIVDSLRDLFFGDDSPSRKAVNISIMLGIIALTIFGLESAMGLVTIGRLERQINLLKELTIIAESHSGTLEKYDDLSKVFDKTVDGLGHYVPFDIFNWVHDILDDNQKAISNILPGGAAWFFLAAIAPFAMKAQRRVKLAVSVMFFIIAVIVGAIIGLVISFGDPNMNALLRFLVGCFSVWSIIKYSNRRNKERPEDLEKKTQSE